jgi:hypothetical protein
MPRVELTGGFYEDSALQFNAQRCVNMHPVTTSSNGGKGNAKLKNVSGYTLLGDGVIGSDFVLLFTIVAGDISYFIYSRSFSGNYQIGIRGFDGNGNTGNNGNINTGNSVQILEARGAYNGRVICIVTDTGDAFYFDTKESNPSISIKKITDPDFPLSVFDVAYKDTYFIWLDSDTDRFYISDSNSIDPTDCVNALDFGTVESNPDPIKGVIGVGNEIAIFGSETIEFYYNSGNVDFPFERNSGATQEVGLLDLDSLNKINNQIYFLGSNQSGYGIIYRLNGYTPERISTSAIEDAIKGLIGEKIVSYTYKTSGGYFYVISFSESRVSYQYNITNGLWSELYNSLDDGNKSYVTVNNHVFAYNKNIFVDKVVNTFAICELSEESYKFLYFENNQFYNINIDRMATLRHITGENKNIQINYFEMDVQKGVGNVDDPDPEIRLYISRDGGMTYGNPISMKMGASGSYKQRVRADMLGMGRDFVFKLESDSPVQQEWFTAYIDYEVMSE